MYLSGLIPEPMSSDDDYKLLKYGIGFTNIVARATKGSADLTRKEIKEGRSLLKYSVNSREPNISLPCKIYNLHKKFFNIR